MKKSLLVALAPVALLMACASTSQPVASTAQTAAAPTYSWTARQPVRQTAFFVKNASCEDTSGFTGSGNVYSAEFQDYKDCMNAEGFELVVSR
ncbi:MAG: hypothetical protein K0U79_10890 [Gammaproteobacteria bacterium]|nr:hypothetical protein [Gammaproteobacteria bacterium]